MLPSDMNLKIKSGTSEYNNESLVSASVGGPEVSRDMRI